MPSPPLPPDTGTTGCNETAWTLVQLSKKRRYPRAPRLLAAPPEPLPEIGLSRPVSAIAAEHRALQAGWESSPCCAALRRLSEQITPFIRVSHAICLGIGTFDPPDGSWEAKRRTHLQLIAFLMIVEQLEKAGGEKISCVFQEPIFNSTDRALVASLGHRVVETPEAFHRVTCDCFLFGIHLYRPVYASALRHKLPTLFVGTGWDVWDRVSLPVPHDLDNLKDMHDTYMQATFPPDPSCTAFSGTSLYWRPFSSSSNSMQDVNPSRPAGDGHLS